MGDKPGRKHLPLKLRNVQKVVKDCLASGRIVYTQHALDEMEVDSINHMEVRQVLRSGRHRSEKDDYDDHHQAWNYRFHGFTAGGERELGVVVSFDAPARLFVVTAFEIAMRHKE